MSTVNRRGLIVAGVGGAITAACARSTYSDVLGSEWRPVSSTYFGMHIRNLTSHSSAATPLLDLGFGSLRCWDTATQWRDLEPVAKGAWNWDLLDEYVSIASNRRKEVLLTLGQAPDWATTRNLQPRYNPQPPLRDADWVDYVAAVAERYRGHIAAYEIWNEPNLAEFFSGSVQRLADLSTLAARAIRQVDPSAKIVTASPTGFPKADEYLSRYLRLLSAEDFDVVAIHSYSQPLGPEAAEAVIANIRRLLDGSSFHHHPLWDTEYTNSSYFMGAKLIENPRPWRSPMPQGEGVAYVARWLLTKRGAGAERAYFYALDAPYSAVRLIDLDHPETIRPAGTAYAYIARLLADGQIGRLRRTGEGYAVPFRCGDGRTGVARWAMKRIEIEARYEFATDSLGNRIEKSRARSLRNEPTFFFD